MKSDKKKWIGALCALTAFCTLGGVAFGLQSHETAKAENVAAVEYDFTDTMDGAAFKAPTSNYGWKVSKGVLTPDNSIAENAQIAYLEQAIALNENKYISLDFYASACPFDLMLLPYAETVNPWATGVGMHCMASGWIRLDTYIDANTGWLSDYTLIGNAVDGYAHKLEITSDGTNLTFKIDGADVFTNATVAIPADSVQLVLRAPEGSYIDNLYIASSKPAKEESVTDVDFTDKTDLNDFTAIALNGWTGGNGKYHPVDAGALYNASATKYNQALDLTGKKYISFDFYSTAATFDVGLLDTAAGNMWGNGLFIHLPFSDGNTIGVNSYVDCTSGTYYDGMSINCIDGKAHTLEIFVDSGKVSYALDGNALVGNGGTAQFNAPANQAYLVFRAVGTESYIDNLYIADSAPTDVDYDFDSLKDGTYFANFNGAGWSAVNGNFVANTEWASTQLKTPLDLTKNQEITFDVYLSSADANKQFNVGFFSEENVATATLEGAGIGFSFGSTLWLGTNLGRAGWIADVAATLYNDTWHSVTISVADKKLSIAVDGVAYSALTANIPADTAYMLMQSTSTENLLDNFKITVEENLPTFYTVTFKNYDGTVLQTGAVEENTLPVYAGETPTKAADENYTYTFAGWDKEIVAATGDVEYVAQFTATLLPLGEVSLDFSNDNAVNEVFAAYSGSLGWSTTDGVYMPNAEWASVSTVKKISLTGKKEISFKVYLSSEDAKDVNRQFNFGFFPTENAEANTQAGSGVNYSLGATLYYGSSFSRVNWVADVAADLYNDALHTVIITVEDGYFSISVDGVTYDTLKAAIPANEAYILMQSKSANTYVDDFSITEIEINPYESVFETYGSSVGWGYAAGKLTPNAAWASMNTVDAIDLTKDWQITFDVYLSSNDTDKQFNVGFFASKNEQTNAQANTGLTLSFGSTIWVSTNFGRNGWASEAVNDYFTDGLHSVCLTIEDKVVTLTVDNEAPVFLTNGIPYTLTLAEDSVYLFFQGTSTETYIQNYAVEEILPTLYTVTFKNWDGTVLQTSEVEENTLPVYAGETPTKVADEENTYTFAGWDKEITVATGAAEYVAQFTATPIPEEPLGDVSLDFSDNAADEVFAAYSASAGWSAVGGVYKANGEWASVSSIKKISLTEKKEISFNVYLAAEDVEDAARQFNFGFFPTADVEANTKAGSGVNYSFASTLWKDSAFSKNNWVADVGINLYDGSVHTVVFTVENGYLSIAVDGVAYDTLKAAIPADEVYILMQSKSTNTYVDNFVIADDILDELSLDFANSAQSEYFSELANGGWTVENGRYYPTQAGAMYNASATKVSQRISLTGKKYISFDFYSTAETFDVGLLDAAASSLWGNGLFIHLPYSDGTIGVTTNVDCTAGTYKFGSTVNVLDGKAHNLKIAIVDGEVSYYLDGALLSESKADVPAEQAFIVFRAVGKTSYIDNLIVSDSDIEYVAPITYLEELSLGFEDSADSDNFVALALDGWTVTDGKYAPAQAGAMYNASAVRSVLPIDLTGTKYISLDFYSTAATFDIGFLDTAAENMWGNGLFIHLPYNDKTTIGVDTYVDCGGSYIGGVAQNPMDGKAHNLLMIVKDGKVAYYLDGVAFSFTANIPSDSAYFVLRAVGTESYIDNLTISGSETTLGEVTLDFSEEVSSKIFTTYYNNGWSVADGKYLPYGVDSTVQTFYKLDLTQNWDIRFNVYLSGTFNIGFFAEPTANSVGAGKSFAFGETLWLGSSLGRNDWIADVGVNLIDNSLHEVRITVLNGNISIAVDGVSYNYVLTTAIPTQKAYLLMQATDVNTYVDDFSISALSAYMLTVKNIYGAAIETVEATGYYTLPERDNDGTSQFIGYYYGGRVYRSTNEISVTENSDLIAIYAQLTMVEGGSIRLSTPTGMRFTSKLDEGAYEYLTELGVVQIGTLIAKAEDVVVDEDYSGLYYNNAYTHLNIVSKVGKFENGAYTYTGVIVNVKPSHYDWLFAARGYIKVTYFDGYELAFYSEGVSRSVANVAKMAYEDRSDTVTQIGETKYLYLTADGDYSPYTEEQLNILQSFLVEKAVYVSVDGNDNNDGTTLEKAVKTFEKAAELTQGSSDALILLDDGEYTLSSTATLGSNVTVKSLTKNGATLSGSKVVDNGTIVEKTDGTLGRVWEIPYSEKINQLYINNSYGVRARYPDAGQELRLFNADETLRTISVFTDDLNGFTAADLQNSVMVTSIQWAESYLRVKSLSNKTLSTGLALTDLRFADVDNVVFVRDLEISPRTSYHFENSKAFLNAQGEWFYDESVQKIYYLPYDNQTLENTTVRIPVTETLVALKGASGELVTNVTFDGVNFMYTANKSVDGKIGGQANANNAFEYANVGGMLNGRTNSAIEAEFVDNITFINNVFACTGAGALDFLQGTSNVTIENNLFRTVGGNGVLVGTLNMDVGAFDAIYAADNSVINTDVYTVNNYFTEIGWQEYGSCAVVYTYAANSKINQNTINNVAYTGISLGWGWEYIPEGAYLENNEILNNRITNVMTTMNDGGGIYLVGCQPNTYVAGNYIADFYNGVYKYPVDLRDDEETEQYWWANAGIYLDTAAGGSTESNPIVVENNYIADDIENQKYEFCNAVKVPNNAVHSKYYFTIDGLTQDEVSSINMSNGVTADDVSGAGASGFSLIPTETILFGAHMLDENTLNVYGAGFGESYDGSLTVNGVQVSASDVIAWSDSEITFTTSAYAGSSANVQVNNSNRLYTAMNVDVASELAQFDGYIDVSNPNTWYTKLDVSKKTIGSVTSTSGTSAYAKDGLYYTAWESAEDDEAASITFTLKVKGMTIDTFILYDRMETDEEEAEYRKNIRIVGITAAGGEVTLYESGDAQAYTNFGMLILDMESLGYGNTTFNGFRIEKVGGGQLSVAEIAII